MVQSIDAAIEILELANQLLKPFVDVTTLLVGIGIGTKIEDRT